MFDFGGSLTGIVCTSSRRRARCFYCDAPHERLCDFQVAPGKTCNRKICLRHATAIDPALGAERDHCADHAGLVPPSTAPVTLRLFTGSVHHHRGDADALDITLLSGGIEGAPFAPSVMLFRPAKATMREVAAMRDDARFDLVRGPAATLAAARLLEAETWAGYRRGYLAEMLVSSAREVPAGWAGDVAQACARGVAPRPEAWARLLRRSRVVLLCYCAARALCHRGLLAEILVRMGASDGGELPPDRNQLSLPLARSSSA